MSGTARPTALVYNPGLHVLGGGERYTFALAGALARDWDVTVAGTALPPVEELARRGFATDLAMEAIRYRDFPAATAGRDLAIAVAIYPPSYPSRAARSALQVSFPFRSPIGWRHPRAAWREQRALRSYDVVISNSEFTRGWVRRRWHVDSEVLYPAVELGTYDEARKERIILSIARFVPPKGHDALLDAYLTLPPELSRTWRLVLVGGATDRPREQDNVRALRTRAAGHNVEVLPNAGSQEVRDLLATASLFWHGAGAARPRTRPEDAEHFGISIVEAMSHGAVPLVHDDGGVGEFVDDRNGVRWDSPSELASASERLMRDASARRTLATRAVVDARRFGVNEFTKAVRRRFPAPTAPDASRG
jgi:glycosyltransferase involved in cell wall biosynthesis